MEVHGTAGDDTLDQRAGALPAGATVYGDAGDDVITLTSGQAIGGQGDDTITGVGDGYVEVDYWDAPAGVNVNLATGQAADGYGTHDTLVNIHSVQGGAFDDTLIGGAGDDSFAPNGGNNVVQGGAGSDTVSYYFEPSTAAQISYDAATDTFTVQKNFANGDHGTDTLSGVEAITFSGAGADGKTILRSDYVGDFRSTDTVQVTLPAGAGVSQFMAGDFNGDGHVDFAYVTQVGTGTAPSPTLFYLGDGSGAFVDATAALIGATPLKIIGGGRSIVADFNGDGRDDLFQLDFGDDEAPFNGGINSLYLSNAAGKLVDASATLPQTLALNHGGSAGDVDGDGDIDILVDTLSRGNVLLLNDGSGHFTENTSHLPQVVAANGVAATNTFSGMVDVNGDGALDLILGGWDGSSVAQGTQILLNDGHGDFTKSAPIVLPAGAVASPIVLEVEAVDLNGDAYPDLMLSETNGGDRAGFYETAYIQLLVNDGTGHYRDETAARLPQSAAPGDGWVTSLTSVDFNHDGYADILAESTGGAITSKVYLNRGDGTFTLDWESAPGVRAFAPTSTATA